MTKQAIWDTSYYYSIAHKASEEMDHPALQLLKLYSVKAKNILEVGCGDGTKLAGIVRDKQQGYGVDLSSKAIDLAKKQFPALTVQVSNAEKLPYQDNYFDLVYSAFMLEHTQNPETVIREMIRVTKENGYIVCIAPNYGAPHRASPCYQDNRVEKMLTGFIRDLIAIFSKPQKLNWKRVLPIATKTQYDVDWDTTAEPYLRTLISFIVNNKLKVMEYSSCWEAAEPKENRINKIFRWLGTHHVYPFIYWGPHLVVVGQKTL